MTSQPVHSFDDNLHKLHELLKGRNASDFLEDLVNSFDGYFAGFLAHCQMLKDNSCRCTECTNDFPDNIE